jgi:hypothetical protein
MMLQVKVKDYASIDDEDSIKSYVQDTGPLLVCLSAQVCDMNATKLNYSYMMGLLCAGMVDLP